EAKAAALAGQFGGRVTWSEGQPERHVIALSFAGTPLQDAQLKRFTPWWWHLPELQDLDLTGTAITDDGLNLVRKGGIKSLGLGGNRGVTDAGVRRLEEALPDLKVTSESLIHAQDGGAR